MTREAVLYITANTNWKEIIEKVEDIGLQDDIAIYKYSPQSKSFNYLILSVNDKIDELIEKIGGKALDNIDIMRINFHNRVTNYKHLYGDSILVSFLPNIKK